MRKKRFGPQDDIQTRFWGNVEKIPGGCWLWQGSTIPGGYGKIMIEGKRLLAHRVAYVWFKGEIPDSLVLDHLCRTPGCVNPDHLEPVTQKTNVLRGTGVGAQHAKSETCPRGHKYDAAFMYKGQPCRYCRTCKREQMKQVELRRKLAKMEGGNDAA